jgi:dihydrofolate synthase/folylpolyglutamate synthase
MGGALDATNVMTPEVCVITRVDLEHTRYLGETEAAIAFEKAGIIKEGVPVITGEEAGDALRVISVAAMDKGCPMSVAGVDFTFDVLESSDEGVLVLLPGIGFEVLLPLLGTYQAANAALACEASLLLRAQGMRLKDEDIATGLSVVSWPGRLQVVGTDPLMIFDVSHTAEGAEATARDVARMKKGRTVMVLGILEDKDAEGIAAALVPIGDTIICTAPLTKRAMPVEILADVCGSHTADVRTSSSVDRALDAAVMEAGQDGTVILAGSFYTVGEGMRWLKARRR